MTESNHSGRQAAIGSPRIMEEAIATKRAATKRILEEARRRGEKAAASDAHMRGYIAKLTGRNT